MIDIFLSRPTWVADQFKEGLENFNSFMETLDLKPRTLGYTDYPTECPLDEVINIMDKCEGIIVLGYPQITIEKGVLKGSSCNNLSLATEWNHIEASLAYAKRLPIIVIHHVGVGRGIFEHGAISKYIYQADLRVPGWFLSDKIKGALKVWQQLVVCRNQGVPHTIDDTPHSLTRRSKISMTRNNTPITNLNSRLNNLLMRINETLTNQEDATIRPFEDEYVALLEKANTLCKDPEVNKMYQSYNPYGMTEILHGTFKALTQIKNDTSRLIAILESQ